MVAIRALLEGAEADLRYLAGMFSAGRIRVEQRGTTYWLSGVGLDNKDTGLEAATELLAVVNGVAMAQNPDFKAVTLPGSFQEDGQPNFAQRRYTLEVRPNLSESPMVTGPWPDGIAYTEAVSRNPHMAEALALMGEPGAELDFARLYKIYEIIEHSGVLDALMRSTGISKGDLRRFTHTANYQDRHARVKIKPPKNPMPIQKARSVISQLLGAWMNSAA
jgi:hypothetical protein